MGEADRVRQFGPQARAIHPGQVQQIQVNVEGKTPLECDCGSSLFIPALRCYRISALESPIGKEIVVNQQVIVCLTCDKVLG